MDRAERWLYAERSRLLEARRPGPYGLEDPVDQLVEQALDGLEALVAAGAVEAGAASRWRAALAAEPAAYAGPDPRAEALLQELLDALPADPESDEEGLDRFEGALHLLRRAGLADTEAWDARLRERAGWPSAEEELAAERELNAGGTQVDLVSVHAGPDGWRGGYRLVLVLRFADAVVLRLQMEADVESEQWPEWELVDSAGGRYRMSGAGGGDGSLDVDFADAPPAGAEWVELRRGDRPEVVFRVAL